MIRGCSQEAADWLGEGGRGLTPSQLMPGKRLAPSFRARELRRIWDGVTAGAERTDCGDGRSCSEEDLERGRELLARWSVGGRGRALPMRGAAGGPGLGQPVGELILADASMARHP